MSQTEQNEVIAAMVNLPIEDLDRLRARYTAVNDTAGVARVDSAVALMGSVQSEALSHSGRLFRQRQADPDTGRVTHTFTGDPSVWMEPFVRGPVHGRISTELFTGENSPEAKDLKARTVKTVLNVGERVIVVRD